jgi:hypothetical protein
MPKKDEAAGAQGHTSNGRGTLLLERKFGTVQIRRASGTKSPDELAAIVELLDALTSTGRLDIVRRVQQGGIRAVELLRRQRAGLGIDLPNLGNPPTCRGRQKWSYAASANFIDGVMPPKAILGRSLLYVQSQRVADSCTASMLSKSVCASQS